MQQYHYKLLACDIFTREICRVISTSPHIIDPEFSELGAHTQSDYLRNILQSRIDAASEGDRSYDAVLLAYGLCGNASTGLKAGKIPLIIPRAHDCATLLLGSKEKFKHYFGKNPSQPFASAGYMDRGEYYLRQEETSVKVFHGDAYADLVDRYGEENAAYIKQIMEPQATEKNEAVFIEIPETTPAGHIAKFYEQASAEGKTQVRLPGSLRLLKKLVNGEWPENEFLKVMPGESTVGCYDWDTVISAKPESE